MSQFLNFGNGHDGSPNAISGTVNTYAACTGTAGQTVLTTALAAVDGDQILIHQTQHATAAGTWEVVKVLSDAGATLNLHTALVNSYSTGAQAILIPQYTGGDISGTVTGADWDGTVGGIIALFSNSALTVSGSITPPGGFRGGSTGSTHGGEGQKGGLDTSRTTANGNGAGGGSTIPVNQRAGGGGGGNGAAGTIGGNIGGSTGGAGGESAGNAELTTFILGGGAGSGDGEGGTSGGTAGGKGSGGVFIFAKNITVTGTIPLTGTAGTDGADHGAGGGGAGGSCLIKCQTAVLGTNRITAAGGAGGNGNSTADGGAGAVGRIRCDYLTSVTGSTTPTLSSAQDLTLIVPSGFFQFF